MIRAILLAALAAALVAILSWWNSTPPQAPDIDVPTATSPQAPASSPRPRPRECAGTVTNNPALEDWRRSLGC